MSATIGKIIENLEKSEAIYQQLLPVIHREKKAAFGSQPDELALAVENKEELLVQLRQLERQRQIFLNQVSAESNTPMSELKLSLLADRVGEDQAFKMRQLSASLNELVRKIKDANEENRLVIQHCLSIVNNALGFFQHWVNPTDVYGASGKMSMYNNNGKLISGAV